MANHNKTVTETTLKFSGFLPSRDKLWEILKENKLIDKFDSMDFSKEAKKALSNIKSNKMYPKSALEKEIESMAPKRDELNCPRCKKADALKLTLKSPYPNAGVACSMCKKAIEVEKGFYHCATEGC